MNIKDLQNILNGKPKSQIIKELKEKEQEEERKKQEWKTQKKLKAKDYTK